MAYRLNKLLEHKLNKRGDVSITILVIGVFAVCTLAILSFLFYNQLNQGVFVNTEIFEDLSSQEENFYFYVNAGYSSQESAQKIGAQIESNRLILNAEENSLSVQYIVDLNK